MHVVFRVSTSHVVGFVSLLLRMLMKIMFTVKYTQTIMKGMLGYDINPDVCVSVPFS